MTVNIKLAPHQYSDAAKELSSRGKLAEAIALYQEALQQYPDHVELYQELGVVQEKARELERKDTTVRSGFSALLQVDGKACLSTENYLLRAKLLTDLSNLTEAIALYQKVIELAPEQPVWVYMALATLLKEESRFIEAVPVYQKIVELKQKEVNHHYLEQAEEHLLQNKINQAVIAYHYAITSYLEAKIVLFMPYYRSKSPERQKEFVYCLEKNIECNEIEKIYLLIDDGYTPEVKSHKVEIINTSSRPTYLDWVELTEKSCCNKISVLANTDIYFDESISRLREICSADPTAFVALSRYEKEGSSQTLHKNPRWSQDVWAISGCYSFTESFKNSLRIPLGVPRCDNKVAYLFAIRGAKVYNPCNYIKTVHVHETQLRNYDKKSDTSIVGGVAYIHPSSDILEPSKLDLDLWAVDFSQIKQIKLNKSLEIWAKERKESLRGASPNLNATNKAAYIPKVDCILFPIIKKEVNELASYFDNILVPTKAKNSLTIVVSIDQVWEDSDVLRIKEAITQSKASSYIREVKFISCNLTESESIYIREVPEELWKISIPSHGLKTGPNLQFFRSIQQLLAEGMYTAVLLQEVDTIPLKNEWIDVINRDIEQFTDALVVGATYSGVSELKPEQINHLNGNAIYCLCNPLFKRFLQLWEQLVIEVCKKVPWKAYDTATEWAIKYLSDDSCWVVDKKKRKDSPFFESKEIKEYLDMYNNHAHNFNKIINKAGPIELMAETIFEPTSISNDLKSSSIIHLRPALPFRDICRYIANEQKFVESNVIGHNDLWQYPAITEGHAYQMARKYLHGYDESIVYFGFPWATLIDQLLHKQDTKHLLSVLESYKSCLKKFTKVVTVCQHVHMLDFQYLFNEVGITDIFWSHAIKGQPTLPEFEKISIYPFPLFPAQAVDVSPKQLKWTFRKYLFSFVGSKSPGYYLTDSRNKIIKYLASDKRGFVRSRDKWHYSDIVYKYQIKKVVDSEHNLIDNSTTLEFKEVLKQSVFSLCPSGSGPNSIRLWESICYGSIPVVLADTYLPPGDLDLWETAVVTCRENLDAIQSLPDRLSAMSGDKELMEGKKKALEILWERYGIDYFIYDIKHLFDVY